MRDEEKIEFLRTMDLFSSVMVCHITQEYSDPVFYGRKIIIIVAPVLLRPLCGNG